MDTAFAHPSTFVKLSEKANLAHTRHTYNLSPGAEDKHIYQIATDSERMVVTQDNDFKRLVRPNMAGVLIIDSHIANTVIDEQLTGFIRVKIRKIL